jgi:cytochrome c oxidase subunit IV
MHRDGRCPPPAIVLAATWTTATPLLGRRSRPTEAATVCGHLHYTLVLVVLSGLLVLRFYHMMIERFKVEYFRRVTSVGYSCVVFGWMTILAAKQAEHFWCSFTPFEYNNV